ncbi:MAG: hypothetical protein IPJ69_03715 [Deltaproteobacteria bacterium]|nr:MAG: hypothetical protein IPJ69_03715 [Deltaproteobacteria bacterium]
MEEVIENQNILKEENREKEEKEEVKQGEEKAQKEQEDRKDIIEGKADNLKINERDKELFSILLSQKFLTFELVAQKFNPELLLVSSTARQNSGLYRRIRRLVQAGYLQSLTSASGKILYLLAKRGLLEVSDRNGLSLVSSLEMSCIEHDLVACEMRFYLESHGGEDWCADREFRPNANRMVKIPDGAIVINNQDIFLEIEFSQKSKDRYEHIARVYRWEKGPPNKVLYVYKNKDDLTYLMSLIGPNLRFGFFPYVHPLPHPREWVGYRGDDKFSLTLYDFLQASPN